MCADDRTLSEVFKLFDLIHILTTDHKTVTRITKEVWVQTFQVVVILYPYTSGNLIYFHFHVQ